MPIIPLFLLDYSCDPHAFDPHGRQGIGVAQPQSGTDYPLVRPSEDIRHLIADFHLAYDDPAEYNGGTPFTPPYHIHWIWGVGCDEGPPSESSMSSLSLSSISSESSSVSSASSEAAEPPHVHPPFHPADIIVEDSLGAIVFNSALPDVTTYKVRDWGSRLKIYEWRSTKDAVCFLVVHTAWTPNDGITPKNYPLIFFPEHAQLDARTVIKLPKRVRSLTAILDNYRETAIEFHAGFNMEILPGVPETVGRRRITPVTFDAAAGNGLGIYPECEPEQLYIRTINGIGPNDKGDFYMAAADCYWLRQPTVLSLGAGLPTTAVSPGNIPEANLPDDDAGTTKSANGWPPNDNPAYAHLQAGSDCPPCCDCEDYVEVADYMNRERDKYQAIGEEFESTRDLYHENRVRWLASLECFHRRPLRIFMQPQLCPYLDVVIMFCNQTDECVTDLVLTVAMFTSPNGGIGTEVPGFTFITGASRKEGRRSSVTERGQMGGEWPAFQAAFESVEPGASVNAQFRLEFADCGTYNATNPYVVAGSLWGTVGGDLITVDNADPPPDTVTAFAIENATLECPAGPNASFDSRKCIDCS
jgi:hypothetical protein